MGQPTDVWIAGAPAAPRHGTDARIARVHVGRRACLEISANLSSIWGTGPNDIWAVGGILSDFESDGRVLHYGGPPNGTSGWTLDSALDVPLAFGNVWGTAEGGAWLQGSAMPRRMGAIYHRAPGGTTWDPVSLPAPPNASFAPDPCAFTAVGSSSASSIWIAGRTGDYTEGFWHGTSADGTTFDWTFSPLVFGALGLNAVWGLGRERQLGRRPVRSRHALEWLEMGTGRHSRDGAACDGIVLAPSGERATTTSGSSATTSLSTRRPEMRPEDSPMKTRIRTVVFDRAGSGCRFRRPRGVFVIVAACASIDDVDEANGAPSASLPDAAPSADASSESDGAVPRPPFDPTDEPVTCAASPTPCAVQLVAGENHFCARMNDGTARCWGDVRPGNSRHERSRSGRCRRS